MNIGDIETVILPFGCLTTTNVQQFCLAISSDPSVAVPLNPFHLTRDHIDLKRAIAAEVSCPVLSGNGVVTRKQRNLKPALIIGVKGCHGAVFLRYEKF